MESSETSFLRSVKSRSRVACITNPVSYTHLDVYKRQVYSLCDVKVFKVKSLKNSLRSQKRIFQNRVVAYSYNIIIFYTGWAKNTASTCNWAQISIPIGQILLDAEPFFAHKIYPCQPTLFASLLHENINFHGYHCMFSLLRYIKRFIRRCDNSSGGRN